MKYYSNIFFWLGGVLTGTITELTVRELIPDARGSGVIARRQQIRGLATELALGQISTTRYCEQAIASCKANVTSTDLERRIIEAASLQAEVVELVEKIPEEYQLWLVVDFPEDWYKELADRWKLDSLFPEERILGISDLKLLRLIPELFYALPQNAGASMDDCLVIDANSIRAVQAIKHGLASIIYVYPQHLKLSLALQGIWQTEANVMHPASSSRVSI